MYLLTCSYICSFLSGGSKDYVFCDHCNKRVAKKTYYDHQNRKPSGPPSTDVMECTAIEDLQSVSTYGNFLLNFDSYKSFFWFLFENKINTIRFFRYSPSITKKIVSSLANQIARFVIEC